MTQLTKGEFYDKVHNLLGNVLHIPPIEYCLLQNGGFYQKFFFVNGNCMICVIRHKGYKVHIFDEWDKPLFLTIQEFIESLESLETS